MVQATQLQLPPALEAERQKMLQAQQYMLQAGSLTLLNAALAQLGPETLVDVLMGKRMLSAVETPPVVRPVPEVRVNETSLEFIKLFAAACKAESVKQQIAATLPEQEAA